jgi:hypothetical protein
MAKASFSSNSNGCDSNITLPDQLTLLESQNHSLRQQMEVLAVELSLAIDWIHQEFGKLFLEFGMTMLWTIN